jgi:cell division protein FtsI/penicillin-binding protein 2
MLSLDIKLQKLVEDMFGDRRGALVAIDPKTGEVLAFVSKPTFDPNLFVEGIDTESWQALNESLDKPLLNRALRGTYPPGSTYKPFMALAALQTGKRGASVVVNDPGYFNFGGHRFGSPEGNLGGVDMRRSIQLSSNIYYYSLANEMGVDLIHDFMKPLGFGQITGIDIARRGARRAAQHRVEAQRLQAARAAEVVRRRDHLAGHRPGLQHLHHAAAGAGHGHRGRRRHQAQAAPGAGHAQHGERAGGAAAAAAGGKPGLHRRPTSRWSARA